MPILSRAGAMLAGAALILSAELIQAAVPPDGAVVDPSAIERLEQWLDVHSDYPRRQDRVTIQLISEQQATTLNASAGAMGLKTRGLYDPDAKLIYLVTPWSTDNPSDLSVLLHDLIHHRQQTARHWYCPGAQEPDAYALQEKWLLEKGLRLNINKIAVILEAGCSPRDVHPG